MADPDLEAKFQAAVRVIHGLPQDGSFQPSNEMKLKFYAFYKQAVYGPCTATRPSFWDMVARAKHDAWISLGSMGQQAAMEKYVEALKQIIETMNFNEDVEKFIEALGPFYEYVDEEKLLAANPHMVGAAERSQATLRELHSYDGVTVDRGLGEEDVDLERMLGHFIPSSEEEEEEEEEMDFNENWEEQSKLLEEIRWTKDHLEQSMQLLKGVSRDAQGEEEGECPGHRRREEIEVRGGGLSQQAIDRMLDNIDGYLPRDVYKTRENASTASLVSPTAHSCEEESDEDDMFEDTLDDIDEMEDSCDGHQLHVDVQVIPWNSESEPSPFDSGIYLPSPETGQQGPGLTCRVPTVPRVHSRQPAPSIEEVEEEEDEILIVASTQPILSPSPPHIVSLTVERMAGDLDHLQARVTSLETILALRQELGVRSSGWWWPFPRLTPKAMLFMVTWPLLTHGLVYLAKMAMRKGRK